MRRKNIDSLLWEFATSLWVVVANEKNGGEPVFDNRRSGRPMKGRYCGEYAKNLRKLVERCHRTGYNSSKLGILLFNLNRQVGWLEAGEPSRSAEGYLQECIDLPHAEKIRQCKLALEYLDEYFAGVDTDGQMPDHVGDNSLSIDACLA